MTGRTVPRAVASAPILQTFIVIKHARYGSQYCSRITFMQNSRWKLWLALVLLLATSLAVVAIPVFVIMPFKAQTETGIEWSYLLRRIAPWITISALIFATPLCILLWRSARWWSRIALLLLLMPLLAATWFARQNHFEWMFNPLSNAAYAKVSEANFVNDNDMVLAVEINGEAVAYPVRQMAYHHVVNDVVGGKPITATY